MIDNPEIYFKHVKQSHKSTFVPPAGTHKQEAHGP